MMWIVFLDSLSGNASERSFKGTSHRDLVSCRNRAYQDNRRPQRRVSIPLIRTAKAFRFTINKTQEVQVVVGHSVVKSGKGAGREKKVWGVKGKVKGAMVINKYGDVIVVTRKPHNGGPNSLII